MSAESYWESQKPEKLNGSLQQAAAAPVSPAVFLFSPFLKLWTRRSLLFFGHWIQTFRRGSSNGFNHTSAITSLQGQSNRDFFGHPIFGHHDSKWFSNEIAKQQHCLLTTANVWTLYLVSRFYGKSYSCQWRTTQNKYPKASEAKCFHFPLWGISNGNLEVLVFIVLRKLSLHNQVCMKKLLWYLCNILWKVASEKFLQDTVVNKIKDLAFVFMKL